VITGTGRRRRFSDDDKARIVEGTLVAGAVISDVTRRHGLSPQQRPAPLGGLSEFEDHGERGLVGETSLGVHRVVADSRERAFDDVGRSQMLPVLGGEAAEGEQRLTILGQTFDGLVLFDAPGFDEGVERGLEGHNQLPSCELSLGCPPGPDRGSWSCEASAILGRTG
jgi:Transposase